MREPWDMRLAAATLAERTARWTAAELSVPPPLWGRGTDDRSAADTGLDAFSDRLTVQITGAGWDVALVVQLECPGWAHTGFLAQSSGAWRRERVASVSDWGALLDDAVLRASRTRVQQAQMVARTCTTGPLDWIHGELWLTPTCLIRVRSGLLDSVVNTTGTGLSARTPAHTIHYDPQALLAAHRTNRVIPLGEIARARLHGGGLTAGLAVEMTDGTHHKLAWLSSDPARRLLTDRLLPVLGERLSR